MSDTIGLPPPDLQDNNSLRRSVTAGDSAPEAYPGGGLLHVNGIYDLINSVYADRLMPDISKRYSRSSDFILASTPSWEGLWASAVNMAVTKMGTKAFEVESDTKLHVKRAMELFHGANDDEGWGHFISQVLQDYLCTDNGAFIEIVRASDSPNARIVGIYHLDSLRCWRTGNRDTPVIYLDDYGEYHKLKWYEVFSISDMPNTRQNYFGVGHCAARRAYPRIRRRVATELYLDEKLNPTAPHTLHFIGGINDATLRNYLYSAEIERRQKGLVVYSGSAFAPMLSKDAISNISIPLTALHDKFDPEVELTHTVILYADAIGLDPQDLKPLGGQALGVGSQSQVLNDKAKGKGLVFFMSRFQHFLQKYVLPYGASFIFVEKDLKEEMEKTQIDGTKIANQAAAIGAGIITPPQGLQALIDDNVYPKEYLPNGLDLTPDIALSDSDALAEADGVTLIPNGQPQPASALPQAGQPAATTPATLPTAATTATPATGEQPATQEEDSAGMQGEAGVSNITVLDDNEPEDENDVPPDSEEEAKEVGAPSVPGVSPTGKKTGAGSRGGKYWIDAKGKVHYGAKPGYAMDRGEATSNLAPKQVRALNRRSAKEDLLDSKTGKPTRNIGEMTKRGWQPATGPGGGYDFGKGSKGKNAAVDEATTLAQKNPDRMYIVTMVEPGKTYAIVSKPINDLPPPPPPKKPDKDSGNVDANIGGAARAKPKTKEKLSADEQKNLVARNMSRAKKIFDTLFGGD